VRRSLEIKIARITADDGEVAEVCR
jgi:hypothetical protein